jgi:predicted transcriptional regulator
MEGLEELRQEMPRAWAKHEEWFRREVEKGRVSSREGRLLDHDDVAARLDQRYPR